MADYGAMLAWQAPRPGREQKAIEVFTEAQETYEKAVANGLLDSFETVLCQPTGGGLPGGWTISWGNEDQIDAWARNEDYQRLVFRAGMVADGLALTRCVRGDALLEGIGAFTEQLPGTT